MVNVLFVGMGGFAGAVIRYLISIIPIKTEFPFHTLCTNIAGALIIGIVVGLIDADALPKSRHQLFWKTGFCGGLTTFSTFSFESLSLIEKGKYVQGGIYIVLSIFFCIVGVMVGRMIVMKARGI